VQEPGALDAKPCEADRLPVSPGRCAGEERVACLSARFLMDLLNGKIGILRQLRSTVHVSRIRAATKTNLEETRDAFTVRSAVSVCAKAQD